MIRAVLLLFTAAGLSAAPPRTSDDLLRAAYAAAARGDVDAAERLYATAAERTPDPGLVAFNRGTVLFDREEYRAAELLFRRCLDDDVIPPDRKVRAWFNLGATLLKRGGSARIYRNAVVCFETCLDLAGPDSGLTTDANRYLELAKLLWAEARLKDSTPDRPNDPPPEEKPERPPPRPETGPSEPGPDATTGPDATAQAAKAVSGTGDGAANGTDQKTPGTGTLPVLTDADGVQRLTPEDTKTYLARISARLDKDRRDTARLVSGPDRKGVRDW